MYLLLSLHCFLVLCFNSGVKGTHLCVLMFLFSPPPRLPCSVLCPKEMALPWTILSFLCHWMACTGVTTGGLVETEVRLALFVLPASVPHLSGRGYIPPGLWCLQVVPPARPRVALDSGHTPPPVFFSPGERHAPPLIFGYLSSPSSAPRAVTPLKRLLHIRVFS